MKTEQVKGTVNTLIFESANTFFKILSLQVVSSTFPWSDEDLVVTGPIGEFSYDQAYRFTGHLVQHPKYGQQFQVATYEPVAPDTEEGLVRFFSSSDFPGIGPTTARKLARYCQEHTLPHFPIDLLQQSDLPLSAKQWVSLKQGLKANQGTETVLIELNKLGLTPALISRLMRRYHEDTLEQLRKNPYQIITDISGVGFKQADQLAVKLGFASDDDLRLQGAILATLQRHQAETGDTYADARECFDQTLALLNSTRSATITSEALAQALVALGDSQAIYVKENAIYLYHDFEIEAQIALGIFKLSQAKIKVKFPHNMRSELERELSMTFDDQQYEAIEGTLTQPLTIITGGPGTGKTTLLRGVLMAFKKLHHISQAQLLNEEDPLVILAAPTGRAAKRLSEATGLPAGTLHRFLGLGLDNQLLEESVHQLKAKLIIVDEMSMVDETLFKLLVQAVRSGTQLVLVGDKDQLPSVGPGQVFADLITSRAVSTIRLTKIYRQQENSTVIQLAHAINQGQVPTDLTQRQVDRSFIVCQPDQVAEAAKKIVASALKHGFKLSQIQLLAPMYRGYDGIDYLNVTIQAWLTAQTGRQKKVTVGQHDFYLQDRLIQLQNNPELGIYNGEVGTLMAIDVGKKGKDQLTVNFDGREVQIERRFWRDLNLAYCVSIHKAQGSEYPLVVLVLTLNQRRMLQRNLVYTAITRMAHKLVLLGQPEAYQVAIKTASGQRHTGLTKQIQQQFGYENESVSSKTISADTPLQYLEEKHDGSQSDDHLNESPSYQLTVALIRSETIDPLIGMHGITPFSESTN